MTRIFAGAFSAPTSRRMSIACRVRYPLEIPHLAKVKELGYAERAWRCLEATTKHVPRNTRV